jgi:hypothetical protein
MAGVALLVAGGAALACCGDDTWTLKLPGTVQRGVVHGDKLYAVTIQGNLIAVDLTQQTVRDYGNFGLPLTGQVSVCSPCYRPDMACVATKDKLHLIDLASGKLVRSLSCGDAVCRFGAQADGHLYVLTSNAKARLGALDIETGKRTEVVPDSASARIRSSSAMLVVGDRLYLADGALSYGIYINHFGYVDLKTGAYHALKAPDKAATRHGLLPGPGGSVYLIGSGCAYRYDADGTMTRVQTSLPARADLVGVWQGNALGVIGGNLLVVTPLAAATARSR